MSLGVIGLLPRNARVTGQILFEGRDFLEMPTNEQRALRGTQLGMIFQDAMRSLNPAYTVGDQIAEGVRIHLGVSRRAALTRAKEMLELVEIPNPDQRLDDYPHMLSGGMRQRVMLAMALACRPKLLLADEPTTALDVTVQSQILALLRSIQQETSLSIVFVTHDLGVIAALCDRVAVVYAGEIVEIGSTASVFYNPSHPYTEGLITSLPSVGDRRYGFIRGAVAFPGSWPRGCHFHSRCDYAITERCDSVKIPMERRSDGSGWTRCARSSELTLRGVNQ
jgi:oligopeptide/dipeptide ABC transporter ATP-binding protein